MQETSALYQQIIAQERHWFETRVVIGDSGNLIDETGERILFGGDSIVVARTGPDSGFQEEVLFSVTTNIEMFADTPQIGQAIAQEIEVKMLSPSGDIPRMAVVIPYVRAVGHIPLGTIAKVNQNTLNINGYAEMSGTTLRLSAESNAVVQNETLKFTGKYGDVYSEWLQQGKYYIDTREISNNDGELPVITLHGYDGMMFAETDYAKTNLEWPAVDVDIVREIAAQIGTQVDPRTIELMTGGYKLPLPTGYSLRETLGIIAAKYIGNFIISDIGLLRLVSLLDLPKETNILIDSNGDYIVFGEDRILV